MRIEAYAKINWTLKVLGTRSDGYHALKSVVSCIPLHDDVILEEADTLNATLLPYGTQDLAYKAATTLATVTGCKRGVAIKVIKRIPVGGGLGGGSADAAAVLKGLNVFWDLGLTENELVHLAADVGSDVPALVLGGEVMMEGRGEIVRRLEADERISMQVPDPKDVVIFNPGIFASTPAVFKEFRQSDCGLGRNDLQPAALRLYPEIAKALKQLESQGLMDVSMSGSGACVYGIRKQRM